MPNTQFTEQHNPQAHRDCCHQHVSVHNFQISLSCKSSSFFKLNDCISFLWKTLRANGKNCKNVSFSKSFTTMKMRKESWVQSYTYHISILKPFFTIVGDEKIQRLWERWLQVGKFFHWSSKIVFKLKLRLSFGKGNKLQCFRKLSPAL